MITVTQPNTIGTLVANDKFNFENDTDIYYFIGNYGVSGFVFWNDTKKVRRTIIMGYYINIKVFKINE
jgi:hypothetical protein